MNRVLIVTLAISTFISSGAQDSLRSVQYENLKQVSFPGKISTTEMKGVKVFYSSSPDLFLECLIVIAQDDSLVKEKFDHYLQLFIEGFSSSESWKYYHREQVDTTLGGVAGILVHFYRSSKPAKLQESFNFFTIVNKRQYVVVVGALRDVTVTIKKEIDDVLKTVVFEGTNY